MPSNAEAKQFIEKIAPLIQKYAAINKIPFASPIIAQACLESNYGLSSLGKHFFNYFGMKCGSSWKGRSVNLATREEYTPGTLTNIKANFRVYSNMEEGVKGYFEFISINRYSNLKNAKSPQDYLEKIKADGYATSNTYVGNNMNVIKKFDLTKYDVSQKTIAELAKEVLDGKWGNGNERKTRLTNAGYDFAKIQAEVNRLLKG